MTPSTRHFNAQSTAAEVLAGVDLSGRRAVVTGGSSGIGAETARALTAAGASVTIAVRNVAAGEQAAKDIEGSTGGRVRVAHLDLTDRATVEAFIAGWTGPLHILVNNAGIMALADRSIAPDGHEMQFSTNYLGHAALTLGLHESLVAAGEARVVNVASAAHTMSPVVFDDIDFAHRPYEAWSAYAQSKSATILFTVAIAGRWAADGIMANALHPGAIMTNLQRHLDEQQLAFVGALDEHGNALEVPAGWKTVQQGAATSALLAGSPDVAGVTGRYFEDCAEALETEPGVRLSGVAGHALDPDQAERLWVETIRLLRS